jgi:hypothetical protein
MLVKQVEIRLKGVVAAACRDGSLLQALGAVQIHAFLVFGQDVGNQPIVEKGQHLLI